MAINRRELLVGGLGALAGLRSRWARADEGKRYGVVVNGDWSFFHGLNVFQSYGFFRAVGCDDVAVLSYPLEVYSNDQRESLYWKADAQQRYVVPEATQPTIAGPATKRNLETVLESMPITANDTLFIHFTGHGQYKDGHSVLEFVDGLYSDDDLAALLARVPGRKISLFDPCQVRGFQKIARNDDIVITRTDTDETDFCRKFTRPYFAGAADAQLAHLADEENKGYVTLRDVFGFAVMRMQQGDIHPDMISPVQDADIRLRQRSKAAIGWTLDDLQQSAHDDYVRSGLAEVPDSVLVTPDNYSSFKVNLWRNPMSMIYFHKDGCGACHMVEQVWPNFAAPVPTYVVRVPKESTDFHKMVINTFAVAQFPTLARFRRGTEDARMIGVRDYSREYSYGVLPDKKVSFLDTTIPHALFMGS